jgi:protein involved in polysaccharide export with SLBB domain
VRFSPRSCSLALVLAWPFVLGCRHAPETSASANASSHPTTLPTTQTSGLGTGDVFEVRVFQEPDLTGIYRLASDGSINFPLCGKVMLTGLSTAAAADRLTECLGRSYLRNPQVSIFVKEYNSKKVFVFGEVQKPGTFVFEDSMNIVQAVTLAGGFSAHASKNSVSVTRLVNGEEQRFKVGVDDIGTGRAENFPLRPGDIVFVPESLF